MNPTVAELIGHPELLNRDTLYGLREIVARHPYFQAARLLFLQNLFLLHDAAFGEELRRAALHIPDRSVLFRMVEGRNYEIRRVTPAPKAAEVPDGTDRTQSLIDDFLRSNAPAESTASAGRRKLTVADATTDYAAFLLELDDIQPDANDGAQSDERAQRNDSLINEFIEKQPARIVLQDTPEYIPEEETPKDEPAEESYFTETLAKIYIKQGRYEKALEIIRRLDLQYPKKNRYFADQIRFLQKLIINNKNKT